MIASPGFALLAVLAASSQPMLLDFHAEWCGPCRAMEPTIRRLTADGYPVRRVDIDRERALAQQFRVESVPTYVLVAENREVARVVGHTSYDQLVGMFGRVPSADGRGPLQPSIAAGRSPAAGQPFAAQPVSAHGPSPAAQLASLPVASGVASADAKARALAATVRLCIDDAGGGRSLGTGTIIDVQQNEALVLTCAHLFRESQGRGRIGVELFPAGASKPAPAQAMELLLWDLQEDLALLAIRLNCAVAPAPIAPTGYRVSPHDTVFSVGCDQGAAPSVRDSRVTALDKYVGPSNIVSSGQPVVGRSGGGLFSAAGYLIGVCNLADPQDNEGIYAALPLVHAKLDKIGQSRLYRENAPATTLVQADQPTAPREAAAGSATASLAPPRMPQQMPAGSLAGGPSAAANDAGRAPASLASHLADTGTITNINDDDEVIIIVRSRRNPQAQSRVVHLDRPSQALRDYVACELRQQTMDEPVTLQASRDNAPSRIDDRAASPIVRGQRY